MEKLFIYTYNTSAAVVPYICSFQFPKRLLTPLEVQTLYLFSRLYMFEHFFTSFSAPLLSPPTV